MSYGRGRGGRGRGRGNQWPGNGPFRNLPPWERPGWIYGPGSCWTLGYRTGTGIPVVPGEFADQPDEIRVLQQRRIALEGQIKSIQEALQNIETRLQELESQ
ncbi:MAG: hypothetical protein RTU30_07740 [Candidatus Thorarchaeota archaeon]